MKIFRAALLLLVIIVQSRAYDFAPDTSVRLKATHPAGVPVRIAKTDNSYFRWPDATEAKVVQDDGNWVKIAAAGRQVWLLERYLELVEPATDDESGNETLTLHIGAWNLEHFQDGASRGFPEFTGQSSLSPRSEDDLKRIAEAIRGHLRLSCLMLSEISGVPGQRQSSELQRLCTYVGPSWAYIIGSSGGRNGSQRVAIIYDQNRVEKISDWEYQIPRREVQGEDVFDRDPLVGYFRAKIGSQPGTDFVLVSLHLASGQGNNRNHNEAMDELRREIRTSLSTRADLRGEKDIMMGGDLNASRYDGSVETFWDGFDSSTTDPLSMNYVTLAGAHAEDYKGTRVKGTPPYPGSYIDYLIGSASLTNRLVLPSAKVHHELAQTGDFYRYRVDFSDHFPITVSLKVAADDDGLQQ
jgi:exonuclease III